MGQAAGDLGIAKRGPKLLNLAFINPRIIDAAVTGTLPPHASSPWFTKTTWPVDFRDQAARL